MLDEIKNGLEEYHQYRNNLMVVKFAIPIVVLIIGVVVFLIGAPIFHTQHQKNRRLKEEVAMLTKMNDERGAAVERLYVLLSEKDEMLDHYRDENKAWEVKHEALMVRVEGLIEERETFESEVSQLVQLKQELERKISNLDLVVRSLEKEKHSLYDSNNRLQEMLTLAPLFQKKDAEAHYVNQPSPKEEKVKVPTKEMKFTAGHINVSPSRQEKVQRGLFYALLSGMGAFILGFAFLWLKRNLWVRFA